MLNSDMTEADPFAPDYSQGLPTLGLGENGLAKKLGPNIPIMVGAAVLIFGAAVIRSIYMRKHSYAADVTAEIMGAAGFSCIPISIVVGDW